MKCLLTKGRTDFNFLPVVSNEKQLQLEINQFFAFLDGSRKLLQVRHNLNRVGGRAAHRFSGRRARRLLGGLAGAWILGFGALNLDQWVATHYHCPFAPNCSYLLVCFLMPALMLALFSIPFKRRDVALPHQKGAGAAGHGLSQAHYPPHVQ